VQSSVIGHQTVLCAWVCG